MFCTLFIWFAVRIAASRSRRARTGAGRSHLRTERSAIIGRDRGERVAGGNLIGSLGDDGPVIHPEAWVAPGAVVVGRVTLGRAASVWYGCVLRADDDEIVVGAESNIQDLCCLHVDAGEPARAGGPGQPRAPGHGARRARRDRRADRHRRVVLGRARVGAGTLIAAGTVVSPGTMVRRGVLMAGRAGPDRRANSPTRTGSRSPGRPGTTSQRAGPCIRRGHPGPTAMAPVSASGVPDARSERSGGPRSTADAGWFGKWP